MTAVVVRGDARRLPLADGTVDAIVCDPPYELGFMGKRWDATGIAYDEKVWLEALRVLKPGGHALVFGGTRTWHRVACAIEDAGFELRDSIAWMYGSGFPKSLDVSKAIDKTRNDRPDVLRVATWLAEVAEAAGVTRAQVDAHMGTSDMGGWWLSRLQHRCAVPTWEQWEKLRELIGFDAEMDAEVWRLNGRKGTPGEAWDQREVLDRIPDRWAGKGDVLQRATQAPRDEALITAPATDAARCWQGWGTALKPAFEPIVVARKPLAGTVAANVLAYGCGGINVDGCRIEHASVADLATSLGKNPGRTDNVTSGVYGADRPQQSVNTAGRWPTNVVLTHQPLVDDDGEVIGDACADGCVDGCPVAELDAQSGTSVSSGGNGARSGQLGYHGGGSGNVGASAGGFGDTGGASRFFPTFRYEPKAPDDERPRVNGIAHPTVKPLDLMRWLVRLVTPPGGLVLDQFAGSGTTAEAALLEGFHVIAVDSDEEGHYIPMIRYRVDRAHRRMQPGMAQLRKAKPAAQTDGQGDLLADLFGGDAA